MEKYVFIDIDGTLYDNHNHCVPESAQFALKRAKENGHKLFICTGRVKEMVESSYRKLPVHGFVYGCGSHIEVNDQIIFQVQFPRKIMNELIHYFQKHDIDFVLEGRDVIYFSGNTMQNYMNYFCKPGNNSEMEAKFRAGIKMKSFLDIDDEGYSQILKIAFQSKQMSSIKPVLDHLPEELTYFTYSDSFSGDIEGEILVKGADKADSIDRVVAYFDGKLENTIALGDSDNDISMLKKASTGIAMGNACNNLKEIADYISTPVYEDGLYLAFEIMELI